MTAKQIALNGRFGTGTVTTSVRASPNEYYSRLAPSVREVVQSDIGSVGVRGEVVHSLDATPQVFALGHRAHPGEWDEFRKAYPPTPKGRHAFSAQVRYLLEKAEQLRE